MHNAGVPFCLRVKYKHTIYSFSFISSVCNLISLQNLNKVLGDQNIYNLFLDVYFEYFLFLMYYVVYETRNHWIDISLF